MSLAEERGRAFYDWEIAGRGWRTFDFPVLLEPAFAPFPGHGPHRREVVDDSQRPSFLASLFGRSKADEPTAAATRTHERQAPASLDEGASFAEYELLVPVDEKIDRSASAAWLQSIASPQGPISFELVGRGGQVSIRIAASDRDIDRVRDHLRTMFPRVVLRRALQSTVHLWLDCGDGIIGGKEMALLHEFMLPLNDPERGQDLFTPLLAHFG